MAWCSMSSSLIAHSPDLQRLLVEGYEVEVCEGYVLLRNVPYVAPRKVVRRGVLATSFEHDGERVLAPQDHVALFAGEMPSHSDGTPMTELVVGTGPALWQDVRVTYTCSRKPRTETAQPRNYLDLYEKLTTYANILGSEARKLEPGTTARTFQVVQPSADESVFKYMDTASSRAGITLATNKLAGQKVAVVGGGGTGSYVVDFVAKTCVAEIHVFDSDRMAAHNAFRAPGAMSVEELRARPNKAAHLRDVYSEIRNHVIAHEYAIDATNVNELRAMDFVFLCMDPVPAKRVIIQRLQEIGVPFIDTGVGLFETDGVIGGKVRTTTSVPGKTDHIGRRISLIDADGANEYSRNIQIAELNALNAALAVIKWKKICGFYTDFGEEHHSSYTLNGNTMTNAERRSCGQ